MEQRLVDGVVFVHGGGGEVLFGLVQVDQQNVSFLLGQPLHTFSHFWALGIVPVTDGSHDFIAGVGAVQVQRTSETVVNWSVHESDTVIAPGQQLEQFGADHLALTRSLEACPGVFQPQGGGDPLPDGVMEHDQQTLLFLSQLGRQIAMQRLLQEVNPAAGIDVAERRLSAFCMTVSSGQL